MKTNWRPTWLACLAVAILVCGCGQLGAAPGPDGPVLQVSATTKDHAVRLEVRGTAPFQYATSHPRPSLFVVDLAGVAPGASEIAQVLDSDVVSSYRVLRVSNAASPSVRIEVLLHFPIEPRISREGDQVLILSFVRPAAVASPTRSPQPPAKPAAAPGPRVAALRATPQRVTTRPVVAAQATSQAAARPTTQPARAETTPSASDKAASVIQNVVVRRNNQQCQVVISGNGRLVYHTLRLYNPERLVLDFSGALMATPKNSISSDEPPIRAVRMGQFQAGTARVVIEMTSGAKYQIVPNGDSLSVVFTSLTAGPTAAPHSNQEPAATQQKTRLHQPAAATRSERVGETTAMALPVALTRPSEALASPIVPEQSESTPASAASADEPAKNGPAQEAKEAATPSPAQQPAAASAVSAAPAPSASSGAASTAPASAAPAVEPVQAPEPAKAGTRFSGEPISVNFKDLDLKDFFRLIHEISGLNVVVDPNVKGTLTLVLDEVPWDQALDIVLRNNNLDEQLEGNVLRIATKDTLKHEAEQRRELAKAQAEAADTVTTTRVLSYAKATDVRDTLKRFLSSRGDILADVRSNTLIIRDIQAVIPVLDNLIRQLDRKSQQVEIEARVVLATRSFAREIGTQFGFAVAGATGNSHNVVGGAGLVGNSPVVRNAGAFPTGTPPPPLVSLPGSSTTAIPGIIGDPIPLVTNLPAASPTSGITFAHTEPNLALDFILTAAETKGVGRTLSKPKVITQNNEKAEVKQGTKIPVQTIINNTISVQFIDAVLRLQVTPQITPDGTVYMEVVVENTQIDPAIPRVEGIPALDTQSAETKVTVNDGGTVVIGGIIVTSQRTNISQVPLFGSLPLIGHLFKDTAVTTSSQELLFFLTPRVLPS